MYESKSMFAKRIGRTLDYVQKMCNRGVFVINDRGFVDVDASLLKYKNRARGRPKTNNKLIKVNVWVRPGQAQKIKRIAKILKNE